LSKKNPIKKISEMRNLGPAVEKDLIAAGVNSADQVIRLGVKKTFLSMLDGRLEHRRSAKCCNALYLYSIYGAIHDIDWRDIPESKKIEFKKYTDKLRKSGKYDSR
jgi:DNA transformation protein and related proteins